jgi:hypothetical protein
MAADVCCGVYYTCVLQVSASAWMSLLMSAFLGFLALTGQCSDTHARAPPACASS